MDGACSVHLLRPIDCRQFNIPCAPGEDAFHTRRGDVMTPIKQFIDEAFDVMLPFYGIKHKADSRKAIKQGALHATVKVMRDCHWQTLPGKMTAYKKK